MSKAEELRKRYKLLAPYGGAKGRAHQCAESPTSQRQR